MATLTTGLSAYRTFDTLADTDTPDTDLAAASGYVVGKPSGATDLWTLDGAGKHLKVNNISFILHVTDGEDGDTITQKLYGTAESGPPQLIASIVWTIGTARVVAATATSLWADTATVTSSHIKTITVADGGGSNRVCSVTFDLIGYRYVLGKFTADTGDPTLVTCLYRTF